LVACALTAALALSRPPPEPSEPAVATAERGVASVSKLTTPMPSSSSSSARNVGAAWCSTAMRSSPGTPEGADMLPELSSTAETATLGLVIALATMSTWKTSPVSVHVAVSCPFAAEPGAPPVYLTHMNTVVVANPCGSGETTDA
jgi:hypothetical protein